MALIKKWLGLKRSSIVMLCLISPTSGASDGKMSGGENVVCTSEHCQGASMLQKATLIGLQPESINSVFPQPPRAPSRAPSRVPSGAPTVSRAPSCYSSRGGLIADEGAGVGDGIGFVSVDACQQECDRRPGCNSISVCPDYGQCWPKAKIVKPDTPLVNSPHGNCETYYKAACQTTSLPTPTPPALTQSPTPSLTPEPTAGTTPAPIPAPSPGPAPPPGASCYYSLGGIIAEEGVGIGDGITYVSADACQEECNRRLGCNSISVCPDYGQCWPKAKIVTPGMPLANPQHGNCDTYYKATCGTSPRPAPTPALTPAPTPARTPAPTPARTPAPTPARTPAPTPARTPAPSLERSCYYSLGGIIAEEGDGVGEGITYVSADACQQECDRRPGCKSISVCPDYGQCWPKAKIVTPGMQLANPQHGNCDTYYKGACGQNPTPTPTRRRLTTPTRRRRTAPTRRRRTAPPVGPCTGPVAGDPCNVPEGQCGTINGDQHCGEVNVRGTLRINSNSLLTTRLLRVHQTGVLQVGDETSPAMNVGIDLQQEGELKSDGQVYIYGKTKTSWTEVAATCDHCKTIQVRECLGWEVGDNIVLVGTGNGHNGQTQANNEYRTDERKIQAIHSGCQIQMDHNAGQKHRAEMINGRIPIYSEVLNMDRSVRIYGAEGIRTRQQHGGVMKIHFTRVSNCGVARLGEYCLHFHHVGPCPQCSFIGNAVGWPSMNKALTVHGTSQAVVEGNVLYDHRGAFLYIEDGNEVGNHIKYNALVCPRKAPHCSLANGILEHKASDEAEQAGMYVVSVTNDFIGNRIAGMENAFFQDFQSGRKIWGDSAIVNKKVCPSANPFGKVQGNRFHNNNGFGFYSPHSSYPTNVRTNNNGLVSDWKSCLGFDLDTGDDNSAGYVVEDHVELFHNFGAGGYDGGETSFKNAVFAFGLASNYYKTFRRGARSGPFCEGCYYYENLYPNTAGGSCMWEYKNTVFENILHGLNINHHCGNNGEWTGGLCASHFWFTGASDWKGHFKINNDGFPAGKQYSDSIVFLKGDTYFGTRHGHPAFSTHACQAGQAGGDWTSCREDKIRIVRIYSANRGTLRVHNINENYGIDVPYTPWQKHPWGRPNAYDKATKYQNGGMGYTFLVKAGHAYRLHVGNSHEMPDFFTLEYSDIQMPVDWIKLSVQGGGAIAGGECTISSNHKRNWITPYGPYTPESGAWWDCQRWSTSYSASQYKAEQEAYLRANGVITST